MQKVSIISDVVVVYVIVTEFVISSVVIVPWLLRRLRRFDGNRVFWQLEIMRSGDKSPQTFQARFCRKFWFLYISIYTVA